ncbi:MAG: hypothetical protein F6K42_09995 [Leptolyngbya sp. SIO1D8]|nr:hypothetical protein [Leptolyngbya sp. SIO1D8]
MAFIQRISLLMGGAATALVAAFPAQAEEVLTQPSAAESPETLFALVEPDTVNEKARKVSSEITTPLSSEFAPEVATESFERSDDTIATAPATHQPSEVAAVDVTTVEIDNTVSTSAETFLEGIELAQTPESTSESQEVAQVTRPLYRGISPFYVGIGGNIGIIDSDESAVGDFGFNIISKVSLGPRFSVRPSATFSEDNISLAIPLTYNFNPVEVGDLNLYPALGAGVDISDDIGLIVNGSVDVPISREFTLNGQLNWRATNDTGLGLALGIGYNFPFFFE